MTDTPTPDGGEDDATELAPSSTPDAPIAPIGQGATEITGVLASDLIPEPRNPLEELTAPVAGFGVTMSTLFRPVVTEQYPREKKPTEPRYHGRHQLNRYADGLEKCIGCELCAWACPADAIYVEGANNTPDAQYAPGERYGSVYQINYLRCIFCGLCIEACPTRALTMTNEFELADVSREKLIFTKDDLLAPIRSGMLAAPHPMAAGTADESYYRGEVTGPTPEQVEWVREHRPQEETLDSAAAAAGQAPPSDSHTGTHR